MKRVCATLLAAITVAAAMLNGLSVAGKAIGEVKLVASGAGAAALACLNLLLKVGLAQHFHERLRQPCDHGPRRALGHHDALP